MKSACGRLAKRHDRRPGAAGGEQTGTAHSEQHRPGGAGLALGCLGRCTNTESIHIVDKKRCVGR